MEMRFVGMMRQDRFVRELAPRFHRREFFGRWLDSRQRPFGSFLTLVRFGDQMVDRVMRSANGLLYVSLHIRTAKRRGHDFGRRPLCIGAFRMGSQRHRSRLII